MLNVGERCSNTSLNGDSCGFGLRCLDPFGISNQNSLNLTCQYRAYATQGQACETTASCSTSEMVCQADFYTPMAACAPRVGLNGACEGYKDQWQCQLGLVCSFVDGTRTNRTCVPIASKGEGEQCWDSSNLDFNGDIPDYECDLSKGLMCINNTCQKPLFPGVDNCTNNYNSDCANSIKDLVSCVLKNKCQMVTIYNNSPNTCFYKHCGGIACNNKCSLQPTKNSRCGSQGIYPACSLYSSGNTLTIQSITTFVLISMIMVIIII
ncbi:hypothetical protein SAMD00019534_111570 [Acytostelium subglobosum LB1]|uniref:hypothetical protein n=1 Tax=Acytostelium subglobosum LB1 TaxID=1410327 RepID=UPI0006448B06|nr:hypothetical protein SAMD00019534_111570 [Acytostelium subglobosum LB1]GAM27981.1 hypothetical protein SAMD00019534_111570 [Acytostelium subglobosum LB1]|eukprot:XP_012748940.1 hypothetical protein SAMD00019534_111570 [Acytostelium subglobosum LB1]